MSDFVEPARDVAAVAARCGSDTLRLQPEWPTVLHWLRRLGRVVARTENRHARIVQAGRFERPAFFGERRAFMGGDFAMACRLDRWKALFATIDEVGRRDLHIFDEHGAAIGSIEANDPAGRPGFDEMVWRLHARDQSTIERTSHRLRAPERPDGEIDAEALGDALAVARGAHERTETLRRFGVTREQSFRLGSAELARQTPLYRVRALLEALAERGIGVVCAIGNAGTIAAHANPLVRVDGVARWSASFASHARVSLDAASVARAWIVRTPSRSGFETSIELFGRGGVPIASFAGARDRDGTELADWRRLAAAMS